MTERFTCVICWKAVERTDLEPVSGKDGVVWNVCKECAAEEKKAGAEY